MSTTDVSKNLAAILDMAARLEARAIDRATDREMPGGDAMVNLAHVGSAEAVANRRDGYERWVIEQGDYERDWDRNPYVEDPEEVWPAVTFLRFWSEAWRVELGHDWEDLRPTLVTEASFLRNPDVLAWAWDNELHFDDFAADVAKAKAKLEAVLLEGERATRSRVACRNPACEKPKMLVRVFGKGDEPDSWKCPFCRKVYSDAEFKRTLAKQMHDQGAERWVSLREAVDALTVQGWQERTVMRWVEPLRHTTDRCTECGEKWPANEHAACPAKHLLGSQIAECGGLLVPVWSGDRNAIVEARCELGTRRTLVWWPSLWTKHLTARAERDERSAARALRAVVQ